MKILDFRSDTVTKPTIAMKEFMFKAEVGDDVFGDDPSVNELEEFAAKMFGMEAGLFCSSGTQTNQIAINVHTSPGDELICHEEAHIYRYEGGGIARNSGVSTRFIRGNQGRVDPTLLEGQINPDDQHYPRTTLLCLEDTANRGGGVIHDFNWIKGARSFSDKHGLKLHLDGARVFNGLVESGVDYLTYGKQFDSISICLSKGLGAPVGSVLIGSSEFIKEARRVRKVFGGGMRQAGILAAAGTYALKHNIDRLKDDHDHAKRVAVILNECSFVKKVIPVATNIVVGHLADGYNEYKIAEAITKHNILCVPFGTGRIRFTTHLGIDGSDINLLNESLPRNL